MATDISKMEGRCRGCDAPIYWLRNRSTGKRAPIDREPPADGRGNCIVDLETGTYIVTKPQPAGRLSHFVTCPERARFSHVH